MDTQATPYPTSADTLTELTAIGMRGARVVARLMEVEQAAVDIVAACLPESIVAPASASEAVTGGLSLDQMAELMAGAVPRVEKLARALERVSRAVRRSVALTKRIEAGWPRVSRADDRPAMVRRQVKRGVSEVIRRVSDSDTAERLFDDLDMRLLDPDLEQDLLDLPVQAIVRRVCRDLGLGVGDLRADRGDIAAAADGARRLPRAPREPPSG